MNWCNHVPWMDSIRLDQRSFPSSLCPPPCHPYSPQGANCEAPCCTVPLHARPFIPLSLLLAVSPLFAFWFPSSSLPFPSPLFADPAPYQPPLHEQQSVRRVASPGAPLSAGCYVRVHVHPKRFPRCHALDWAQLIVADTPDFVVVDKPAGVPVSLPPPCPPAHNRRSTDSAHEPLRRKLEPCLITPCMPVVCQ